MAEPFLYRNDARKRSTTVILALVIAAIFAMWVFLDAHWLIVVPLSVCVGLAMFDWLRNPKYAFEITDNNISWTSGEVFSTLGVDTLDHVVMSTRLDFSTRVTFHQKDGSKMRLHPACTPPQAVLGAQLKARDIEVVQKHFTFVS